LTEALRVGCAGFPVGRDRYWRSLSFVEARTGEAMPRPATLAAWRADAPEGGEFSVSAFRLITHAPSDRGFPPAGRRLSPARRLQCGGFRESLEAYEAWLATKTAAETLGARLVVFETPPSFAPGPDRLRDMYRFFKGAARGRLTLVWQPRAGEWTPRLADKVCADLGLLRAFDPLREAPPARGSLRYLRPRGPRVGGLGVDELSTIRAAAADVPSYVVFSHRDAFRDAERLLSLRRIS
jgi:uncharacterized protein YecE (DUF72 family)